MKSAALLILGLVGVVLFLRQKDLDSAPEAVAHREAVAKKNDVYYNARTVVKNALKAPASAKFSNPLTDAGTGSLQRADGTWEAFGFVDAQNSFGANLRQSWHVIFDDSGRVAYLRLGDQTSGTFPEAEKSSRTARQGALLQPSRR